jgi:hypothetical protein
LVKGLDVFRSYFQDYADRYVLIGGVACDLLFDEAGLPFRATKDLDIVLCAEVLDGDFVGQFWEFVKRGGYQTQQKSTGEKQYYRFLNPGDESFPVMLELFSRQPDGVSLEGDAHLTPIPVEQDADSLSAILLDDDYYQCLQQGKREIDGLTLLRAEFVLAFKARAWLDNTSRKQNGHEVDAKDIKKHRNDVFRLSQLLAPEQQVPISDPIRNDMRRFIAAMREEQGVDPKSLGIRNQTLEDLLQLLESTFCGGGRA